MSWHKHQEYDPTAAFLQNNRLQKVLDLKMDDIDKLWFSQLKHISKEKLETMLDLSKLEEEKQRLKYFDVNMEAHEIREHGEDMAKQLKKLKLEGKHNNYNFELMRERTTLSVPVTTFPQIPQLTRGKTTVGKSVKRTTKKHTHAKKNKVSKVKMTRKFSRSDSNLHLITRGSDSDTRESEQEDIVKIANDKAQVEASFASVTDKFLPLIHPPGEDKPSDHRFVRQKMMTSLVTLPPVKEVTHQRKYSV